MFNQASKCWCIYSWSCYALPLLLCALTLILRFFRVLDNLKDYAVRALVNAVDHLGTVAYKLTDLVEQQTLDVTSMELKVTCLDQVT